MAAQFSVPIPYALTDTHRKNRIMGKVTVRPRGPPDGGETPLLEQSTSRAPPTWPTILLPILNCRSRFAPSHRSRREHKIQQHKMAVSQAASRKKHRLPSAQEKRNRVSKPSKNNQSQLSQTVLWRTMIGPGTRVGNTKYAPIIIDDDVEEQVVDREDASPGHRSFFSNFTPSTPQSQRTSIYASSPSTPSSDGSSPVRRSIPSRMRGPWTSMSSPASEYGKYRDKSIYVDARRDTTVAAQSAPRSNLLAAGDQQYRSCPPPALKTALADRSRQGITLADIPSAGTRRKVADLMAVAPALPVQDLLDLLTQAEGSFTAARRQAERASRPPRAASSIKSEQGQTTGLSSNGRLTGYDCDGDEVMIKIDPNADFLEYDTDSPPPEDTCTAKGEAARRGGKHKFTKHFSKPRAGVAFKKKPAGKARKNSIERDFIDADNVIHLDTDFASSDTNSSTLGTSNDVDMEDAAEDNAEDLTIDVQPRYAFNSTILKRARKR